MKKVFIIGAVVIGTLASAFPFRTSCGLVFQVNPQNMTPEAVNFQLTQLNFNACGVFPTRIVYYISSVN
ncbi:hypothetical protein GCM10022217_03540 [Chryseobacterium ginsenosidimutans]|uniref:hypothetical protein n=1 Tax=Chryseobacterium ginsenosidimutans TaxID=687846 RepID=UPI0031D3F533